MTYEMHIPTLTITAPDKTVTHYPTLAALMTAHAALELSSHPQPARSDKSTRRQERIEAGQ